MNKIITRDWINDDIVFHSGMKRNNLLIDTYTKKDFCEFINHWKLTLLSNGAKRGDKIGFVIEPSDIHPYAVMFAAFELGMKVVVLHRPNNLKECMLPKSNAHMPLDFFVYLSVYKTHPLLSTAMRHFEKNSKVVLSYGPIEWEQKKHTFRSKEETPILAQPGDVALLCNSSGTTGTPKLISHSHEFFYDLCSYNWRELKFDGDDHFLHLSSLHHGAALSFFLPALHICKNHYFYNSVHGKEEDQYIRLINDCVKYGITRIFCTHGAVLNEFIKHLENREVKLPHTNIMLLSFISPEWCSIVKNGGLQSISSPFGCSELCGPVFMTWLDSDTVDNFNPKYLGKPTEGFYKTHVIDGRIHTSTPYNDVIVFDDIVEEKSDGYYFVSKNRLQKLNDIDINPLDIIEILEKYATRYQFEIFIDEVYNELYILTSNVVAFAQKTYIKNEIDSFYQNNVIVSDIIYVPDLGEATISNKADRDKLAGIVDNHRLTKHNNPV